MYRGVLCRVEWLKSPVNHSGWATGEMEKCHASEVPGVIHLRLHATPLSHTHSPTRGQSEISTKADRDGLLFDTLSTTSHSIMRRVLHFTQQSKAIAHAQSVLGALAQSKQTIDIPVKSKFVTWQDVKTWKDANYVAPHQGPAFDMVRQILSEKPRTFHEIIDVGLELHANKLAQIQPGSEAAEAAQRAVTQSRALSKKKRPENDTTPRIPEGHPFISAK